MTSRREFLAVSAAAVAATRWPLHLPEPVAAGTTLLFQGDSITDAGRDRTRSGANDIRALGSGYPLLLAAELREQYAGRDLQVFNRGISGNTVPDLQERWQVDTIALNPAMLSILIGVNDIWHVRDKPHEGAAARYEAGYAALLASTRAALPACATHRDGAVRAARRRRERCLVPRVRRFPRRGQARGQGGECHVRSAARHAAGAGQEVVARILAGRRRPSHARRASGDRAAVGQDGGEALAPMWILDRTGKALARFLTKPRAHEHRATTSRPDALKAVLRKGDVLLIEGNTRISVTIKYLTQSSWSHAALCIGDALGPPADGGEPNVLLEADVSEGVRAVPIGSYLTQHTRICRPVGLSDDEINRVIAYAVARLGRQYDRKHIWDLARYLLPTPPIPTRWRRRLLAIGSGDPTRAICSTLIAEAFDSVGYPILPHPLLTRGGEPAADADAAEVKRIHAQGLFVPRDFDVSPYFQIIKPTLEQGFDPHLALA